MPRPRLIAISGLGAKEPAAFVVEADGRRLLLDCGEGPEPGRLPDFAAIGKIELLERESAMIPQDIEPCFLELRIVVMIYAVDADNLAPFR